jgi:hypothetical protein
MSSDTTDLTDLKTCVSAAIDTTTTRRHPRPHLTLIKQAIEP